MKLAALLLAAGASRRFGTEDKLLAKLHGKPLISYAANTMRALAPDMLIAVTRSDAAFDQLEGFDIVRPSMPDPLQGDSLAAGIAHAQTRGAERVLIALGDMPFVSLGLLQQVASTCRSDRPSTASNGDHPIPPACFPASFFPRLLALGGDRGAGVLLRGLPDDARVHAPPSELQDVDTTEALNKLNEGDP